MKYIVYKKVSSILVADMPKEIEIDIQLPYNEKNIAYAKTQGKDGKYQVIEDKENEITQLDRIEAQVVYTAMLTDSLLEA